MIKAMTKKRTFAMLGNLFKQEESLTKDTQQKALFSLQFNGDHS